MGGYRLSGHSVKPSWETVCIIAPLRGTSTTFRIADVLLAKSLATGYGYMSLAPMVGGHRLSRHGVKPSWEKLCILAPLRWKIIMFRFVDVLLIESLAMALVMRAYTPM